MIHRTLSLRLREAAKRFPVVTLTGPRQSGKTTLVRAEFPDAGYCSLEQPDQRTFAVRDPRGFLAQFDGPVVLDEVQRAPDLFSYIQTIVDTEDRPGRFILTGSHNFLLLERVSQSLAGRCAILHLLPLSLAELWGREPIALDDLGKKVAREKAPAGANLFQVLFTGFYPRIHDKRIPPREWLDGYCQTYVERDVRSVLNVGDLETFNRFMRLCAARSGQILNLAGVAADCGITHTTARRWISVLEASFVIALLRPHHRNFGKRVIKSPKLYFLDSGLLCYLLRIREPEDLAQHAMRGAVFEGFVLAELYKNYFHRGERPELYFWRDSQGHEVDILIDLGRKLIPVEVKSAQTIAEDFFDGLTWWRELSRKPRGPSALIHGGSDSHRRGGAVVYPWFVL